MGKIKDTLIEADGVDKLFLVIILGISIPSIIVSLAAGVYWGALHAAAIASIGTELVYYRTIAHKYRP